MIASLPPFRRSRRRITVCRPLLALACAAALLVAPSMPLLSQASAARVVQSAAVDPAELYFGALEWRNIGPANMAGRVTHIEAVESNPAIVFVAAASGGVWKSTNAGTTWEPIFERYGSPNVGAVAVFQPNPDIVWVGTGEACVRNSVGWGDGIYKSTDGGKTFVNVGLRESHHIDEIVVHPTDPNIVYVAAQGHLWGYNDERGVFKTTDGGRTWRKLTRGLPNDGKTGASALVMDPTNPNILYAGMWERIRFPHKFLSGGPNGGIYKSTDGGESWTKLTNGLPSGDIGKIGLAVHRRDPRVVMAIVEHGFQPRPNDPAYRDMTQLGTGVYRSEDGGATWQFMSRENDRPFYYSHIFLDPVDPKRVYLLATNASVSEDGGRTFRNAMPGIAGDYHALWIDPANPKRMYVGNDKGASVSYDGGEHFILFDNMDIGQFYAVTVDNRDPYWVYGGLQDNGNWGGPSNSRDYNGILTDHWFKFHSGDGFHATVDPTDWRTVYTESQNGNVRRLDAVFRQTGRSITPNPSNIVNWSEFAGAQPAAAPQGRGGFGRLPRDRFRFNWSTPLIISPHDSRTLYLGGNYLFKSTDRGDTWRIISPDLSTNDPELTDPRSGGLTPDASGAETHATAITISESPLVPGVIWVGTDDGNVQLTRDGGKTWTNVRPNIPTPSARGRNQSARGVPERTWVSRVEASHFDPATAYVSFDGHRTDDFRPYVWKTTDYGRTWTDITANLPPNEPVYVVKEDLKNPNLLFVGTEMSAFASVDGGKSWHRIMHGLPTVPVHDLVIHPRDGDLIAATHGRSVWILDDITPLQQLTPEVMASDAHLFTQRVATQWRGISRGATRGHLMFMGRNPLTIAPRQPGNSPSELQNSATVTFWVKEAPAQPVRLEIIGLADTTQRFVTEIAAKPGLNRYFWNMRFSPPATRQVAGGRPGADDDDDAGPARRFGQGGGGAPARPGTYRLVLTVNGKSLVGSLAIRDDPEASKIDP